MKSLEKITYITPDFFLIILYTTLQRKYGLESNLRSYAAECNLLLDFFGFS